MWLFKTTNGENIMGIPAGKNHIQSKICSQLCLRSPIIEKFF